MKRAPLNTKNTSHHRGFIKLTKKNRESQVKFAIWHVSIKRPLLPFFSPQLWLKNDLAPRSARIRPRRSDIEKVFTSFPLNRGSLTRKGRTEKELDSCDIDRKSAALHCSMLIFWQIFNMEIKAERLSTRQPSDSFCWPLCGAGTFTLERRY